MVAAAAPACSRRPGGGRAWRQRRQWGSGSSWGVSRALRAYDFACTDWAEESHVFWHFDNDRPARVPGGGEPQGEAPHVHRQPEVNKYTHVCVRASVYLSISNRLQCVWGAMRGWANLMLMHLICNHHHRQRRRAEGAAGAVGRLEAGLHQEGQRTWMMLGLAGLRVCLPSAQSVRPVLDIHDSLTPLPSSHQRPH